MEISIGALLLINNIEAFWRFGVVMIVPIRNLFVEAIDIRSWIANKQLVKLYGVLSRIGASQLIELLRMRIGGI